MLKIHQLFLRSFIFIFIGILIFVSLVSYSWLKSTHIKEVEKNLIQNIDSFSIALSSLENLDEQVKLLKENTNLRITIIDANGVVIAESDKDKNSMDNHLNREEIKNINSQGIGKIIRKSNTVNKQMLNVVKKTTINSEQIYIRMGSYLTQIESQFINLTIQFIAIFSIFLLIALVIIYYISKRMQIQTNMILRFLTKLSAKEGFNKSDLESLHADFTLEFFQITNLLKKVAVKISKKDKLKSKHNAALKLSNKQKDEIISAISHEFKNPIAIISGYSETILNDDELTPAIKEKFLKKIHNNANKMATLIDRLRVSLKFEENKQEGFFKPYSIYKICSEVIEDLGQKYKEREIVLVGDDIILNIDETLFYMAVENLVENALKYSEDKVTIKIEKKSLCVIDMGIGIEIEELDKIKQKFYRISKNDWNNSLGLGLFIVQKILNLHNFTLDIQSEYNFGSKFIINFK